MKAKTQIEFDYSCAVDEDGELVLFVGARKNDPGEERYIIYDRSDNAMFYRNKAKSEIIILDYLDEIAQKALTKCSSVTVAEVDREKDVIVRDYKVDVRVLPMLPNRKVFDALPTVESLTKEVDEAIGAELNKT